MDTCTECGLIHPPVARGQCPVAKGKQVRQQAESEVSTVVTNLSFDIQKAYLVKIQKIDSVEQKELIGKKILEFINTLQI